MKTIFILIFSIFFSDLSAQTFSVNNNTKIDNSFLSHPAELSKGFYLTHSGSQIPEPGKTVLCNDGNFHFENSYYLVYDLKNDFNLNGDWIVESVEIAIESASAGNSSKQPLIVKLYVMSEYNHRDFLRDSLTLLVSDTVSIFDSESGTLKNIDFSPGYIVSEGKVLVVEFLLPDGHEDNNLLFLGSNTDRISDSTYIRAPHCGINEPINVSKILYPDMMLIAKIYGQYASPNPQIQSFNIQGQIIETEIKNNPDFTVKVVMPADTVLNNLSPVIQIPAGFQITPASEEITDFSQGSVIYTVDNNFLKVSQSWSVDVINAGPDIIGANLPELNGEVLIEDNPNFTVTIPVTEGSDISDLSPTILTYEEFTVNPESGTSQDFSSGSVTYTVSHRTLPLTQDWQVSVIETSAGIDDSKKNNIKIFPNPAKDYIQISGLGITKIEILDFSGRKILTSQEKKINISLFKSGIYLIRIYDNNKIINKRIILIN